MKTEQKPHLFHSHEGKELTAQLSGEPGSRVITLRDNKGQIVGDVPYAELVGGKCMGIFGSEAGEGDGDVDDFILIDSARLRALAEWAESAAIGPMAIGEESHE